MNKVVLVGGTNSLHSDDWYKKPSPFSQFLLSHDILHAKDDPFEWSSDLDGFSLFPFAARKHNDWEGAGASLSYYLESIPYTDRNIISHSHGRQVVLYCATHNNRIRRWIDVSGPIRDDLDRVTKSAEQQIAHSIHIYSNLDYMQILGSLMDGKLGYNPSCPISANIKLPHKVGHSGLLQDQRHFHYWKDLELIKYLME